MNTLNSPQSLESPSYTPIPLSEAQIQAFAAEIAAVITSEKEWEYTHLKRSIETLQDI